MTRLFTLVFAAAFFESTWAWCGVGVIEPFPGTWSFPSVPRPKQVPLPLIGLDASAKVSANLASTILKFNYTNPSKNDTLNIKFTFPVDVDTAIYKVSVAYSDGATFDAKIEEKSKAKKDYEKAKEEGHKATLVKTKDGEDDRLTLELSNLDAGISAVIEVHTSQELQFTSGGFLKYKLPTSMFVRYGGAIDNFSTLRSVLPGYMGAAYNVTPKFSFTLDVDPSVNMLNEEAFLFDTEDFEFSKGTDHANADDKIASQIAAVNKNSVFSKDADVEIMFQGNIGATQTEFISTQEGNTLYSHFIPSSKFSENPRPDGAKPLEYILIVDNSGSMDGDRIKNAKLAVKQIVNSLPVGSGFNIVKYGSNPERIFPESKMYTQDNKELALNYIEAMGSDMGGTEILQALQFSMCDGENCKVAKEDADFDKIRNYEVNTNLTISRGTEGVYKDNANEGWVLKSSNEKANRVEVTIKAGLFIESHSGCNYDGLTFRVFKNGKEDTAQRQIICGDKPSEQKFTFDGDEVKAGFYSDGSVHKGGFAFSWTAEHVPELDVAEAAPVKQEVEQFHGVKQVFVITDGDISNQQTVFDYLDSQTENMRTFSIGIGAGASSALVKGMAKHGGGYAAFISEEENAFYKTETLASVVVQGLIAAGNSYIHDVKFSGASQDAYVPEVITEGVFIHVPVPSVPADSRLEYVLETVDGQKTTEGVDFRAAEAVESTLTEGSIAAIMGKRHLQHLVMKFKMTAGSDEREALKTEIVDISKETNVLCPLTAFIGIHKSKNGTSTTAKASDVSVSAMNSAGSRYVSKSFASVGRSFAPIRAYQSRSMIGAAIVPHRSPTTTADPATDAMMMAYDMAEDDDMDMAAESARPATHNYVATTTTTSTTTTTTTPAALSTYHDITNAQHVDGHWSKSSLVNFLTDDQVIAIDALVLKIRGAELTADTKYSISALVLLKDRFGGESGDWAQSSVKAWEYIQREAGFSGRISASAAVREIIRAMGSTVSVYGVIA